MMINKINNTKTIAADDPQFAIIFTPPFLSFHIILWKNDKMCEYFLDSCFFYGLNLGNFTHILSFLLCF